MNQRRGQPGHKRKMHGALPFVLLSGMPCVDINGVEEKSFEYDPKP